MSSMTSKKSVVANTAVLSGDAGTATADATAIAGTYNFYVEQLATAGQVAYNGISDATAAGAGTLQVTLANGSNFTVDLNAADKDLDGTLSAKEIAAAVNTAVDNKAMVVASTMTINGSSTLVLTSAETGGDGLSSGITLDASGASGELQGMLDPGLAQELVMGQNAKVWVGPQGTGTLVEQASNTFTTVDGVKMNFTKAGSAVTLTVANDTAGTAANVQAFVEAWNKAVGTIRALVDPGDPATGKAGGIFAGDAGVNALLTRMQALLRQKVGTESLVSYGLISQRNGTMALDSARLAKSIASDSATLDTLFGNSSLSAPSGVLGSLDGLIKQWTSSTDGQVGVRKDTNSRLQKTLTQRQERLDTQYNTAYARYLDQFTRLQALQSQMNNNTSIFDALFGNKDNN
jgi:flagellar hook-associated protein 2